MSIWESIWVALDNLRLNKLRSFLTMIGIVFGVAAVVTVVSIGQAGQSSILSIVSVYEDGYFVIYQNPMESGSDGDTDFRLRDLTEIRKLDGVRYASSSLPYSMTMKYKKDTLRFTITATTHQTSRMQKSISLRDVSLLLKRSGPGRRLLWWTVSLPKRCMARRRRLSGGSWCCRMERSASSASINRRIPF